VATTTPQTHGRALLLLRGAFRIVAAFRVMAAA
jgi:hypothetical protein